MRRPRFVGAPRVASLVAVRGSRICFAALGLALVAPVPAAAQSDGVFVDPDSPTAKQYAIPLESARRQADPGGDGRLAPPGARPPGTGAPPLFGDGIVATSSARRGSSSGNPGGATRGTKRDSSSSSPSTAGSTDSSSPVEAAVTNPGAPSSGIESTLLIAAGAALVLLIGGLAGFVLRRRSTE